MNLKERIKKLATNQGISLPVLEANLGFGNGTIVKWDKSTPNADKLQKVADYFGVSMDYLMTGNENSFEDKYYINDETAQVAQEIFENKELRALFNVQKNMDPDDLRALHNMALALKRKEKGFIDDTGC